MKILFIGGGNMARAIIGGLIAKNYSPTSFLAIEPAENPRKNLQAAFGIAVAPSITADAAKDNWDAIVLAVKPQAMKEAIAPLAGKLSQALVVSIAAGIRIGDLSRWLGNYPYIVRTMPNTPALIHAGVTGLCAAAGVPESGRALAQRLLSAVGRTLWLDDEVMLDAVTAVSGSGPAYVFYFIEALEQAAREMGLRADAASTFARETFRGAAQLAATSVETPDVLRAQVTSKGGTTARAIESFDAQQLKTQFIEGVKAAWMRSRELGEELGQD